MNHLHPKVIAFVLWYRNTFHIGSSHIFVLQKSNLSLWVWQRKHFDFVHKTSGKRGIVSITVVCFIPVLYKYMKLSFFMELLFFFPGLCACHVLVFIAWTCWLYLVLSWKDKRIYFWDALCAVVIEIWCNIYLSMWAWKSYQMLQKLCCWKVLL